MTSSSSWLVKELRLIFHISVSDVNQRREWGDGEAW